MREARGWPAVVGSCAPCRASVPSGRSGARPYNRQVPVVKTLFWGALGALAWTHVGYPLAAGLAARLRPRPVRASRLGAAGDGDRRGARRGGGDRAAAGEPARARLSRRPARGRRRLGRLHGRNRRARRGRGCAGAPRAPARAARAAARSRPRTGPCARRRARSSRSRTRTRRGRPMRCAGSSQPLADPEVAYVCGRLRLQAADGSNREGLYWRYELWLREQESRLGSITGGNGSIYALRREDYVEVDPRFGHDLAFPYLMVQRGRRAVYEPAARRVREADALERGRVPAQGADVRALLADHAARLDASPAAARLPRRGRLAPRAPLRQRRAARRPARHVARARRRGAASTRLVLAGQLALLGAAAAGMPVARYYVLVSWATVQALANYLRRGVPATWEPRRHAVNRARRRRARRGRARRSRARCSLPRRSRSSSRTAGRCSTGRRASARTASTSSCSSCARWSSAPRRRAPATPSTAATRGSRASAASCAGRRSTSCRSSGTCCAARCRSSGRGRRSATRSSATTSGSAGGSTCARA